MNMREQRGYTTNAPMRTRQPIAHDIYDEPRTNTSAKRYVAQPTPRTIVRFTTHTGSLIQRRASRMAASTEQPLAIATRAQSAKQKHWLFYGGVSLTLMLSGWMAFSLVGHWWNGVQDDMHYGRPRTAQYDVNVGHGGISHFTVENLGGHILIVEVQVSDPSKAKIYVGPTLTGPGADGAPATLTFADVNGDGLTDMIITVDNTKYVFLNSKNGFHSENGG